MFKQITKKCKYIHTLTHKHTHINIYTHTLTHTHTHTHTYKSIHITNKHTKR